MNIFYLHHDPVTCATLHTDKHVVKMILEYAQLLSTAHRVLDGVPTIDRGGATGRQRTTYILPDNRDPLLYRATHINHPSAVWVRQSDKNYDWLYSMFRALMSEYTYRYGKVHATSRLESVLANAPNNISLGPFTEPTPAMPDEFKVKSNSIQSYINYYVGAKRHLANWKKRPTPTWYNIGIIT
jgi:hypothetical protein